MIMTPKRKLETTGSEDSKVRVITNKKEEKKKKLKELVLNEKLLSI